ncbi:hypothetical protein [Pelotomaculum propionicicum]|uniref:Uncharacterized protein n=1 Tax=Pelotomaculum propionicicum TaxID=258475 RepID=A0A4Y7RSU7_9FIRM|nr:hypothetical protein [Pelotomaculum propionicicum]NLI13269.1 hypothetical protein [Peptococcaceae bacterium]TEB12094.1 hypothetical protein Pmgp_01250 [Pelotomaculum propionicicum]
MAHRKRTNAGNFQMNNKVRDFANEVGREIAVDFKDPANRRKKGFANPNANQNWYQKS